VADLSGKQKAAAVLASVDAETAAAVLKNLPESDLETLTREMHSLGTLGPDTTTAVLQEFAVRASTQSRGISVGPSTLRQRLELALGPENARQLLKDVGIENDVEAVFRPFGELDPEELYRALADEHPQTIALVLGQLEPKQVAGVLGLLPPEIQVDVIRRMSTNQQLDEGVARKVAEILHTKTSVLGELRKTPEDPRYKKVAEVINLLGPEAEERILQELAEETPALVEKLKEMMFVFEDLRNLRDTDMRQLLMAVETQILAMALKTASEELKEKVFGNLSKRAAEMVREELELLGRKPLSQVKAAQQQIIETVRNLDASGEINLRGAKYEEDPLV